MKALVHSSPLYLLLALLVPAGARPALAQIGAFPAVTISATHARVNEAGPDTGTFTVTRHLPPDTPPPNTSLVVFFQVSGTASNGVDYEKLPSTVTIPPLALGATITVTPIDDTLVEGDETVVVQITASPLACASCGYDIGVPSNAVVVIVDNETNPVPQAVVNVVATDDTASEIPVVPPWLGMVQRADPAVFTFTRSGPTDFPMTVFYSIGGTATKGVDYFLDPPDGGDQRPGGHVVIPTGAASAQVSVWVIDDLLVEGTETVELTVQPPVCIQIFPPPPDCYLVGPDSHAVAKILDDDLTPPAEVTVVATDPDASENGPDPGRFTVYRTGDTSNALAVYYAVGGTAEMGLDYVTVADSDAFLNAFGFTNVVIPAGASSAEITVVPIDDPLLEGNETVVLHLEQPPWAGYIVGTPGRAVVTIADDDTVHRGVNIYATDPNASEIGSGPTIKPPSDSAVFTVRRFGETNDGIVVYYEISGTASKGVDYAELPGQVTIPAGASSAEIVINPIDDNLVEGTETVILTLLAPCPQCLFANPPCDPLVFEGTNCYLIGPDNKAVAYIHDNDAGTNHPPVVRLVAPREGGVFAAPADIVLVAFAQDEEDKYQLQVEFFAGSHSLGFGTFVPGRCAVCPNYVLIWSNVPPGDYSFTANATDSNGASSISDAVHVTVVESNRPPVVSIVARDPFASEGTNFWLREWSVYHSALDLWNAWHVNVGGTNTATFVVHRHGPTNSALTVNYQVGGTASNGVDYLALSGSVTIPAGRRSAQIVVVPIDDDLDEGIETVVLKLQSSPDYVVGFPARAAAIIIDENTPRPPCLRLRDGLFHLCGPATNGLCFRIEASGDLLNWVPVCTNVVTEGALHFVDPDAPGADVRFYRTAPESGLPPDD